PALKRKVIPYPIEEYSCFAAKTHKLKNVDKRPHKPGKDPAKLKSFNFCYGLSASYSSHCAPINVAENGLLIGVFLFRHQRTCELSLLHGYRSQGRKQVSLLIL